MERLPDSTAPGVRSASIGSRFLTTFRGQKLISSGVVEGLNNKAKVTMRKSYGFSHLSDTRLALYHSLGKLPEPESTHDFF
jgi:transposase